MYSKVCGLPKVNCLSCSLRLTDSVSVFSLLGGTGVCTVFQGPQGANRSWNKLVVVTVVLPLESRCIFLKYIIAVCILWPAVVFKIRTSVTMSENTTCQLCCSARGYSTFLLCAVVLLTKHQVSFKALYQTWSHSPFFSLGSEWSVMRELN